MTGTDGAQLYNTLTRTKEPIPVSPDGEIRIYVCGPTVYGPIHVGNARPFVVFALISRYLRHTGHRVTLASNLTDINDKIYTAANREGVSSGELAERYGAAYIADTDRLGLGRPDSEPLVTQTLEPIIAMIQRLIDRGLAYAAGGDVYFRVRSFPEYGALSGRKLDQMLDTDPGIAKEDPLDFALWKGHKPGEDTYWDSPWGPGRPGWHIECSAMAHEAFGDDFEIHGGGIDLVFPHHENEIAQTEGAQGCRMAKMWVHNEMVEFAGDKMSKSDGNIVTLHDALERWPAEHLVLLFVRSHYRSKLPFSDDAMDETARVAERLRNGLRGLDRAIGAPGEGVDTTLAVALQEARARFFACLADDFNTPGALAAVFSLVAAINTAIGSDNRPGVEQLTAVRTETLTLLEILGLGALAQDDAPLPAAVRDLLTQRSIAREQRDFQRSDDLRDQLLSLGFQVRDTADGQEVTPR